MNDVDSLCFEQFGLLLLFFFVFWGFSEKFAERKACEWQSVWLNIWVCGNLSCKPPGCTSVCSCCRWCYLLPCTKPGGPDNVKEHPALFNSSYFLQQNLYQCNNDCPQIWFLICSTQWVLSENLSNLRESTVIALQVLAKGGDSPVLHNH